MTRVSKLLSDGAYSSWPFSWKFPGYRGRCAPRNPPPPRAQQLGTPIPRPFQNVTHVSNRSAGRASTSFPLPEPSHSLYSLISYLADLRSVYSLQILTFRPFFFFVPFLGSFGSPRLLLSPCAPLPGAPPPVQRHLPTCSPYRKHENTATLWKSCTTLLYPQAATTDTNCKVVSIRDLPPSAQTELPAPLCKSKICSGSRGSTRI